MSVTSVQKFGLTGTLLGIIGSLLFILFDIERSAQFAHMPIMLMFFPSLLMSFLIYKFPNPNAIVKIVAVAACLPACFPFFVFSFLEPGRGASVAAIVFIGALMWTLAAFPKSLKQNTGSK